MTGDGNKIQWSKEQYCIGTWNVRSMNQDKLEVVKQEMERVNIDILGVSKLKWTGMGEFNSDNHYIYYCGQESLRRNGEAIIVNKRVQNAVLGCNLKNDRMISVRFQGKQSNITVTQVYALTSNAEEQLLDGWMVVESWMVPWRPIRHSRTNTWKRCPFHHRGLECKSRKLRVAWSKFSKFDLGVQNEAGQRLIEFCQENTLVITSMLFQQYKRRCYTWTSPDGQYSNQIDDIFWSQR